MEVTLDVGGPAAGGTCVARLDGRVVFVSRALPGELVRARIDDPDPSAKFWRADTVDVLRRSPERVPVRWPEAAGVGGAEYAHVDLAASRRLKAAVIAEQFRRLAHLDIDVLVEPAGGDDERDGLGWRTRMQFAVTPDGRIGAMAARSHDVRPLTGLPLAVPELAELGLTGMRFRGARKVEAIASSGGDLLVIVHYPAGRPTAADTRALEPLVSTGASVVQSAKPPRPAGAKRKKMRARAEVLAGSDHVTERVALPGAGTQDFRVTLGGFWQVHRAAPELLARQVARSAGVRPGDRVGDLYCGAGLFTVDLAAAAGPGGAVVGIEGDGGAAADLACNAGAAGPGTAPIDVRRGPVAAKLPGNDSLDVVVLDPPRAGAGKEVAARIAACRPRTIAYVSCDPATLARDCRYLVDAGYRMDEIRAFDLFPLTAHVESVVTLRATE